MTLGVRLKQARLKKKLTQEELATTVGIKQQAVQRIEAGKVRSTSYIVQLARALDITPEWLALGEGSLNDPNPSIADGKMAYAASQGALPLLEWNDIAALSNLAQASGRKFTLPPAAGQDCFALELKDNSMTGTGDVSFLKGDVLFAKVQNIAQSGSFVLAKLPDSTQLTFRQYVSDGHGASLKPLNSHYATVPVTHSVKICAVVFGRYTALH